MKIKERRPVLLFKEPGTPFRNRPTERIKKAIMRIRQISRNLLHPFVIDLMNDPSYMNTAGVLSCPGCKVMGIATPT
jgi:hypothetical protein